MPLVDSEVCRFGESGGVGRPYFTVGRGWREGYDGVIDHEANAAHDIDVRDVVGVVACGMAGEATGDGVANAEGFAIGAEWLLKLHFHCFGLGDA